MNTKLLKQKILDLAIRGKLVPQDPNDEPASVLLQRIRAEREQLIVQGKIKRSKSTSDNQHYENVPFEIPESWAWTTIGELLINRDSERIPLSSAVREKQINKIYPYYGAAGVIDYVDKYLFSERLLLIGEDGANLLTRSKDNAFFAEGQYWVNNHAHVLDCTEKVILDFVAFVINASALDEYVTGSAQPKLSQDNLNKIRIPLPPLDEQGRIIKAKEQWFTLIDEIETSKQDLHDTIKQTKSKVLSLAICGKLVPQDPNDEPAIELLKRLNPHFTPCDTSHYENLPENWCVATLGDVGKWQAGGTPKRGIKEYYGGDIPWLKTGDLNDDYIREIPESITQTGLDNSSAKLNPKDSVLIAMYGATIGKLGILTFPATTNQACCACVEYPALDMMYLFYFLLSHRDVFVSQGGGGAQPNISKEIIVNTQIPIPPLAEQKRIVVALEKVFSQIDSITAEL